MSGLDLTPAAAAAPAARRIRAHALTELGIVLRNGEQLLLAVVIPVGLLVGGRLLADRFPVTLDALVPSVLALAVWSSTFTSLAILTGFERRDGVLERLVATPLGPTGLIAGKAVAVTAVAATQCLLLGLLGLALGWRPRGGPVDALIALAATGLAGLAFAGLALVPAGRLKAEVTLALANLVYLAGLVAGIMIPVDVFPPVLRPIVWALPTGALGETLRASAIGATVAWPLLVLLGWAAGSILLARKAFRWMS
ncbi:ABC transporter permease [Propionicicella superfundia]|uniref:ABC transporter permease n=1 Tax=Propionicicella superfundia TaxID=348582 RepID=UPI0004123ED7|nr:ABC transporter permease [Propionicicella superfundia]